MNISNTPYGAFKQNRGIVKKQEIKPAPNIFDYMRGNVEFVESKPETKKPAQRPDNNTKDVVVISDQTLTKLRNEYIEATLESGEPLEGISYDDFVWYYIDKQGFRWEDETMQRLYSQALKGDNASCAEREWRTNPDFIIMPRIFDSPELTEDREAAFEKFKNGEELTELENRLLSTFPDAAEGQRRINEVNFERGKIAFWQNLHDKLASSGVELSPDDEITFTVYGYELIDVKGTVDDEKLAAIKEAMKNDAYSLDMIYNNKYNSEKMGGDIRYEFSKFKKAQHYLDLAGGGSLLDISKDSDGNYHGIPDILDKFLRENKQYKGQIIADIQAMWVCQAFDAAISAIEAGRYDWYKSQICTVTYKNGEFFA